MFKWLRVLVLLIGGCLLLLRLIFAPEYVKINNIKMKYEPFKYISWDEFFNEYTKEWEESILRDKTFHEQPVETRLEVAKNFYHRNIASKPDVLNQPREIKDKLQSYFLDTAKVMDEATFRIIFPEYDDLSNEKIKQSLYDKFYKKDMPFDEFNKLFSGKNYSPSSTERQIFIKVSGPHKGIVPSKDIETIIIHSISLAILIGIIFYLLSVIENKRKKIEPYKGNE